MSWIVGAAATRFGRHEGRTTLDLMTEAADAALANAHLVRGEIDGLLCGYSTTHPHLMLATLFAEHYGLAPAYAHGLQLGGATGFAMVMLAGELVAAGVAERILVVAGENRMTGQSRDSAISTLAQVGHPIYEVPLGPTIPAYYGLVASRYLHETGASSADLAELAVQMRRHAARHPGAQFREPISVEDVLAARPIAPPLTLLDCCPVSDGGAAVIVAREPADGPAVRILGAGQAHTHQHVTMAPDRIGIGARFASERAFAQAGIRADQIRYGAIYDSFTVTLAILLEEIGLVPAGEAGAAARAGRFDLEGELPLNTHGGLLSYGHCGVGGAMAHLVEAWLQMTERAAERQVADASLVLAHGDGGVLSSHVSLVLERTR